ncbi:twin-arginine translocase TatA/TatE family subunit [Kribbella italica]|uniref:Sec-independent protein translocase protein TatA n=1 Tax=Kribbella italica TaxID=1540520 RepID=A0A7W9JFM6_9ACTN|nr:twin-arginine translocase TatA/TatE family subunit [Kribbella italica]MBB5841070.1 sec-independent protein translocase protein TatA [Kribbella italica]
METLLALPEGGEWIVLLVVVVLLFGANRLPELTRNTARALVELKKITREAKLDPSPVEPTAEERARPAVSDVEEVRPGARVEGEQPQQKPVSDG